METPHEKYKRRMEEEAGVPTVKFEENMEAVIREIEKELKEAQEKCSPHIDDGSMFYGYCENCGVCLG